jgi:hypothetical protein
LIVAVAALATIVIAAATDGDRNSLVTPVVEGDPFAYESSHQAELEARAAVGLSHVLYAKSPGGALATAERVAGFREEVERAAARSGTDPDTLEAIAFLESAGRPEVIAGSDPEAAAGLTQIVASTGRDLLGMRIGLKRSRKLTREMAEASGLGDEERFRRLLAERAHVDERFDPEEALAATVRYLGIATERFGRDDLAVVSYHMGIGNLEEVVRAYLSVEGNEPVRDLVEGEELSYAELYFASSPLSHPEAWDLLASFGDESSDYYWKVLAAEGIMRLYREDRERLRRLEELHGAKATAEEVFHPEDETEVFDDPGELEAAFQRGEILPLPDAPDAGYVVANQLGRRAPELGVDRALYRGLRPEALATLLYMTAQVRALNGGEGVLTVTSAVRDRRYQDLLASGNPEATDHYSLHTTGWSFDIRRRYGSDEQAAAFQFALDRLRSLAVIDYAVEPNAIHVTVSDAVEPLLSGGS